ncbi:hypothetical protein EOM57_01260 [Candidatus Saccharibacteria bacterium]|nr:hypothetical protein [Candidatus Saccharibacteria bacterium]
MNGRAKLAINWLRGNKLAVVVLMALLVTAILTWISMWIYHINDVSRLDISRPGYEVVRESVQRQEEAGMFQATGKLDKKAVDLFLKEFNAKRKLLDGNSRFDPGVLSDEQLELVSVPETVE